MHELYIERTMEANPGAVRIDGFDECVIGTVDRDGGERQVLAYSMAAITGRQMEEYSRFCRENGTEDLEPEYRWSSAISDAEGMISFLDPHDPNSPVIVDDL